MAELTKNKHPSEWEVYDFVKTLTKCKIGRGHQINTSEIQPKGKYPVIDQSQDYIAGYSDSAEKVYSPTQPLVIFGDHTRCFKFVDFPFIVGADGTKVLSPNTTLFNPKFYYFYLLSLNIPSRGYNRHFKLLKEKKVVRPSVIEQENIAHILSKIQSVIETQEKIIQTTTELKKVLMQKLFAEGLRGEEQKETEIGKVPKSWQIVKLGDAVSYIDYGFSKAIPKTPIKDGVKIVSTADITKDGKLLYHKIRKVIAPVKTTARLTLKDGDVLFNWRNTAELIGKSSVFQEQSEPHIFASFILRIRCDEKQSHNRFLCYLMNHFREKGVFVKLSRRAVNQANYNKNEISVLPIPLPPYQEQVKIAETLSTVERKIESNKSIKAKFETLFAGLLHNLMTGQIRVKDLDIGKAGVA